MADEKKLQKTNGRFEGVGKIVLNENSFKRATSDSGYNYVRINFSLDTGNGNRVNLSAMGGYNPTNPMSLKFFDNEGMFEVDWNNRFNEAVLKAVPNYSKFTVGVQKDDSGKVVYSNYLSWYDAVDELQEYLKDGMIVKVKGNLKPQEFTSNDGSTNVSIQKDLTSIYLTEAEEDEFGIHFVQGVVIERDGIGKIDEKEGKWTLECKVFEYDGQEKKIRPFTMKYNAYLEDYKNDEAFKSVRKWLAPEKNTCHYVEIVGDIIESRNTRKATKDDYSAELLSLGLWDEEELLDANIQEGDGKKITEWRLTSLNKKKDKESGKITLIKDINKYKIEDLTFVPSVKKVDLDGEINLDDLDDLDIDLD